MDHRFHRNKGYTLVEIVISILLTAVMVSAVFSVALTTRAGGGKADRKLLAAQAGKTLASTLKNYVTGDPANTIIEGPNSRRAGADKWKINTPGPPPIQEDRACTLTWSAGQVTGVSLGAVQDVYALAPGNHCIVCVAAPADESACFLPKSMRGPPYNGVLYYTVAGNPPLARIGTFWTEP